MLRKCCKSLWPAGEGSVSAGRASMSHALAADRSPKRWCLVFPRGFFWSRCFSSAGGCHINSLTFNKCLRRQGVACGALTPLRAEGFALRSILVTGYPLFRPTARDWSTPIAIYGPREKRADTARCRDSLDLPARDPVAHFCFCDSLLLNTGYLRTPEEYDIAVA